MERKKNYVLVAIATTIAAMVFVGCSENNAQAERPNGSGRSWQTADLGTLETFEGRLSYGDPEWYLETDTGSIQLGLGNPSYLESTGLELEDDMEVAVEGYLTDDELSVVSLTVDGREVAFRTEDGVPLWAGRGVASATRPATPEENPPLRDDPQEGQGRNSESSGRGRGGGPGRSDRENRGNSAKSI